MAGRRSLGGRIQPRLLRPSGADHRLLICMGPETENRLPQGEPNEGSGAQDADSDDQPLTFPTTPDVSAPPSDVSVSLPDTPTDARAALVGRLASELAALVASGDHDAARILHETIGRLLTASAPPVSSGEPAAPVLSLVEERRRRSK